MMKVKRTFNRAYIALIHDLIMAALSFVLSLYLRWGGSLGGRWDAPRILMATGLFTLVAACVFWSQRMYRGVWRYASLNDLLTILRAVTLTILIFLPLLFLLTRLEDLPRSVLAINWFVLLALLGGPRFVYRLYKDRHAGVVMERQGVRRTPVLLVGASDAADMFIRATLQGESQYHVVGIVSETMGRVGRNIHGIEVLGTVAELTAVAGELARRGTPPQRVVLSDDRISGEAVRVLLEEVEAMGMTLARLPRLTDLKNGVTDKVEVTPIAIEDLLGRPQAVLDRDGMAALIKNRRVLVTGAGGSIGSELVRQISDFDPAHLTLLDACEFNLYSIDMELSHRHPDVPRRPVLADIRDIERLNQVMVEARPDLVFHAAALKHVPMVEANPAEGLLTNALGTKAVADACRNVGVKVMVQISTDKAVNPTNVMGAAKRLAESYCQALDLLEAQRAGGTRYVTVRFGNVLGSTGSVVPLFQKQLEAGGPLTVTHPEMTRYFLTVREAVELVLQASVLGVANPTYQGKIFVLDMGEPIKIVDLARQMIRLSGRRVDKDVGIIFTGLRPGEKLFEEIFHGAEPPVPTENKSILVAAPRTVNHGTLSADFAELQAVCRRGDEAALRERVKRLVPEYHEPTDAQPVKAGVLG